MRNLPGENTILRPEEPDDEPFLYEVYESTRQEELDRTGWDEAMRQSFLRMQFQAMRQGYSSAFADAEFAVIVHEGTAVGRVVIDRTETEIRLVDMALLTEHRNTGIGTQLTRQLQREAGQAGKPLRLRVFHESPANRLYERLGFKEIETNGPYRHLEWRANRRGD